MISPVSREDDSPKPWSPIGGPAMDSPMTERILDAALQRFEAQGIAATTMGELAADAGISRAWLYRNFENREAVLRALIARQCRQLAADVARAANYSLPRVERMANAFVHIVRFLRENALLQRVLVADREQTVPYLLEDAAPVLRWGVETLTTMLQVGDDGLPPVHAKHVGETFVRLVFSIAITPSLGADFDNPRELRAYATRIARGLLTTR